MVRRLFSRNVVVQCQQMARSLTCDSNCLRAKYGVPSSCQKWSQMAESVADERVTRSHPTGTCPTLDLCDRFPQVAQPPAVEEEPRKFHNLLRQRRPVDPSRLQCVNERHQKFIAEAELRQLNARPSVTRAGLHAAWWKAKNT